ncbi:tRNA-guanine transglycosylase DpdA [Candidatus Caldatribacterium sp.]|uniref:tRNA-guanine transglycosylase DpdA n=1 Tax=Candidatus Caldatribacterium sp. TaxID=2282143 RepID=UPI00383D34CC|nr:tRNA-guanine transglycosylase DpdA [Candidatus Caldatribacterium sp.]
MPDGTNHILYFFPNWEDRIHQEFDFLSDLEPQPIRDGYNKSLYAHEVFDDPPYDGVLVSLATFEHKIRVHYDGGTPTIRGFRSIKKYLRIDRATRPLPVMGDCGAFTYVNCEEPPEYAAPQRIANLYHALDFDFGISPDHIIVDSIVVRQGQTVRKHKLTLEEKEKRRQISLENADKFLKYVKTNNLSFTPIGAVQGHDVATFVDSALQLVGMGYEYIALGGLVRRKTQEVAVLTETVTKAVRQRSTTVKIHLLGVLRLELLPLFKALNITSFDSTSFLRRAWLSPQTNYLGVDGKWYAAIRIPPSYDPRVQQMASRKGIDIASLKQLERRAMLAMEAYERGNLPLESTLEAVMEYDQLLERRDEKPGELLEAYRRTLESRIWRYCPCPMCRVAGIHVVIFRGNNRNKRRGFHNVNLFYRTFLNGGFDGTSSPHYELLLEEA